MYKGVNASEGIGIGTVAVAVEPDLSFEAHAVEDAAAEKERYAKALDVFCQKTEAQAEAMKNAKRAILDVAADFEKTFGRKYGFFEAYRMEDAELAIVLMGSSAGTAKAAVDELRESGVKAGLIKIRVFRPFPGEELAEALKNCKAVAVLDKSEGFSACGGPLFAETASACINLTQRPKMVDIVYGLGGRDITPEHFKDIYARLTDIANGGELGPVYTHLGQRG